MPHPCVARHWPVVRKRCEEYAFELKTAWSDGTRVIFFSSEELVARLAALVPPPRMHLVHYLGVLAPNAKLCPLVVPEPPQEETTLTCGAECIEEGRDGRTARCRWVPWAELFLKTIAVDVLECPKCQGRMQRIAWITSPRVIDAILACVLRKEEPP